MQINNFWHIKRFLERFTKKVLAFIGTNDQEISMMKNKVQRDLGTSERLTEEKIKQFKTYITEKSEASEGRVDASLDMMRNKINGMDNKLAQVEVTEVILDFVRTEIRRVRMQVQDEMEESNANISNRFDKLFREELTYMDGNLFGKDEMYMNAMSVMTARTNAFPEVVATATDGQDGQEPGEPIAEPENADAEADLKAQAEGQGAPEGEAAAVGEG